MLNRHKFCINQIINKVPMLEIFVNLICMNQTPVYSEHKSWIPRGFSLDSFHCNK